MGSDKCQSGESCNNGGAGAVAFMKDAPIAIIKANMLKSSMEVDLEDKDGRKLAGAGGDLSGNKLSEQTPPNLFL